MTDAHFDELEKAKSEATEAYQRLRQHQGVKPASLGPFGPNMKATDERRLLGAYQRLLSIQFRYKSDVDIATAVALAESQLSEVGIGFENEAAQCRAQLQKQYMDLRHSTDQARDSVFSWRESIFTGRIDLSSYRSQITNMETIAESGLREYPEDTYFMAMREQAIAFRKEI